MPQDNLKHIDEVSRVLITAGITIKLRKCCFYSKVADCLGHPIVPCKLQMARQTAEAIEVLQ